MPISLTKNVQQTNYTFYIETTFLYIDDKQVIAQALHYQSVNHFHDGFIPIIRRVEIVTDQIAVAVINAQYPTDITAATNTLENHLIASVAWYTGGSIVAPAFAREMSK